MSDIIYRLKDGNIVDISTDYDMESEGCPTCGWGGVYLHEIEIIFEGSKYKKLRLEFVRDSTYPSIEDVLEFFVDNAEIIETMSVNEFAEMIAKYIIYEDGVSYKLY